MFPPWIIVLLVASGAAGVAGAIIAIRRKDVPWNIYLPVVAAPNVALVLIVFFAFTHDIHYVEISLFCSLATFLAVRRSGAYRWEHGGKERYETLKHELTEKVEQRRREANHEI